MNLEAMYFIGQTIAAIAIVGSLIFVGLQMRAQARETRLASMAEIMAEYRSTMTHVGTNRDLRASILKCNEVGTANLDPIDRCQVSLMSAMSLRVFEQAYFYRLEGKMNNRTWRSVEGMMSSTLLYRAPIDYFRLRKGTFEDGFIDYFEAQFEDAFERWEEDAGGYDPNETLELGIKR